MHCTNFCNACIKALIIYHYTVDIAAVLHEEDDWNESHEVVPVSQDCDSSDGTARKPFLVT